MFYCYLLDCHILLYQPIITAYGNYYGALNGCISRFIVRAFRNACGCMASEYYEFLVILENM